MGHAKVWKPRYPVPFSEAFWSLLQKGRQKGIGEVSPGAPVDGEQAAEF